MRKLTVAEFDRHAAWVDGDDAEFEGRLATLKQEGRVDAVAESSLRFFREHGWVKLNQAVSHTLIDKVLQDVEFAWHDLPPQLVWSRAVA